MTARYAPEVEEAKFWSRVDRTDDCWNWTACKQSAGRGLMQWRGRKTLAYRISWEIEHGSPPPSDVFVCHHCDNGLCVRPSHLFLGTCADNNRDMRNKGRGKVPHPSGIGHHNAYISDEMVANARLRVAAGEARSAVAADIGVSSTTLGDWVRGRVRVAAGGPINGGKPARVMRWIG